jgi:hypothetical protein
MARSPPTTLNSSAAIRLPNHVQERCIGGQSFVKENADISSVLLEQTISGLVLDSRPRPNYWRALSATG